MTDNKRIKNHFQLRFKERVGYTLTDEAYQKLCKDTMQSGKYLHRSSHDPKRSVYSVRLKEGFNIRVVYDPFNSKLYTVL